MLSYLDTNDILGAVYLSLQHPSNKDKIFCFVEGVSDIKFYGSIINNSLIEIESSKTGDINVNGKKDIINLMEKINNEEIFSHYKNRIIAICDADFDHIENLISDYQSKNIFMTDYHDIEIMMLSNKNCWESFLYEFMIPAHIKSIGFNMLKNCIDVAKIIGSLRYINSKNDLNLNFKKLNYSQFIQVNENYEPSINLELLIEILLSRSPSVTDKDPQILINLYYDLIHKNPDLYKEYILHICCGHDITNVIFVIYRHDNYRISLEKNINSSVIESALRLSYNKDYFKQTKLFSSLSEKFPGEKLTV